MSLRSIRLGRDLSYSVLFVVYSVQCELARSFGAPQVGGGHLAAAMSGVTSAPSLV